MNLDDIETAITMLETASKVIDHNLPGHRQYVKDLELGVWKAREQIKELCNSPPQKHKYIDPNYVPDVCECPLPLCHLAHFARGRFDIACQLWDSG